MKAYNFNFTNTLKIVLAYAALVFILAVLLTSCASTRPYQGCYVGKHPLVKADTTEKKTGHGATGAKQSGAINS